MSELYCTVHFHYSEGGLPKEITNFVESQFMKARDEAIKLLNPHYEEWNNDYTGSDEEYNRYISSKQNAILEEFNRKWMGPVKLWADEYGDIAGKFKVYGKAITMHMTIKLLNENRA